MKFKKICSVLMSAVVTASYFLQGITVTANNEELHNQNVSTVNDDFSVDGTNSFGNLIASGIENEMADKEENNGCKIYSLEMNGNTAKVSFDTTVDCSLVVAIYDDAGEKMLTSGTSEISSSKTSVEIPVDIDVMPEYFYLKAYMVDSKTLSPVCSVYENPNYTSVMKDFFDKTTDDFDAEKVINFDDDITNNFAVYGEDTKIIEYSDSVNVLTDRDDTKGTYVFENVDEKISALQPNDIFTYNCGSNEDVIVKVKTISIDGTTATITAAETSLDEIFEYVKIDSSMNEENSEFNTDKIDNVLYSSFDDEEINKNSIDTLSESVKLVRNYMSGLKKSSNVDFDNELDVDIDNGVDVTDKLTVHIKTIDETTDDYKNYSSYSSKEVAEEFGEKCVDIKTKFSSEISFSNSLSLKIYINKDKKDDESLIDYFELKISSSIEFDLKVKNEINVEVPFFNVSYFFYGFVVSWTPKFTVESSGEVEYKATLSETVGVKIDDGKTEDISEAPKFKSDLKLEGTLAIGLSLGPEMKFVSKYVASLDFIATVKIQIKGTLEYELEKTLDDAKPDDKHECMLLTTDGDVGCITGSIDAIAKIGIKAKLFNSDNISAEVSGESTWHLKDFYYSMKYDEFAFGLCPHKAYYYNLTIEDLDGNIVEDAEIDVDGMKYQTDEYGKATVYLYPGDNKVTVSKDKFDNKNAVLKLKVETTASTDSDYEIKGTGSKETEEDKKTGKPKDKYTSGLELNASITFGELTQSVKVNNRTSRDKTLKLSPVMYPVKVNAVDKNGKAVNAVLKTNYMHDDINEFLSSSILGISSSCILNLPVGTWDITVTPKESYYKEQTQSVTVNEDDENIEITFTFEDTRAGATIILTDQYGKPVPDASVNIEKIGESKLVGTLPTTDENGIYTTNLSKGDYEVTVKKTGYETVTQTFTVGDESLDIEITIQCNDNSQDNTDNDDNQDISGNIIDSGTCGKNVFWELNDTGLLRIYGIGSMKNWYTGYNNYPPYYSQKDSIKEVIIDNGVTSIGYDAFSDCAGLTEITIPDSVTSIGSRAFYGCTSLTNIKIPDSVTIINEGVFKNCTGLTEITIPDGVTIINEGAFEGCTGLASITIPNSVTTIRRHAFRGCTSLTNIKIPDSVTIIGEGAFRSCTSLTNIKIPNDVEKINEYVFYGCTSLIEIEISDNITNIDNYAFSNCTSLIEIEIPDNVTSIENYAFSDCTNLEKMTIFDSTEIMYSAFKGCENLKTLIIAYGSEIPDKITMKYVWSQIEEVIIPNSITSIGSRAFYDCTSLTSIAIPDSVTSIGEGAFYGCTGLTEIIIPDSVTSIGEGAFYGCTGLTEIIIPDSVTSIGSRAFYGCTSLTSIAIPDSVTSIEEKSFYNCRSIKKVTIPNSVTNIEYTSFDYCKSITDIYYAGTKEEWKNISAFLGPYSDPTKLKIHYNSTGPEENVLTPSPAPPIMRLPATSAPTTTTTTVTKPTTTTPTTTGTVTTSVTDITTISTGVATKNITDLKPNTVYNFYSMKSRDAENPLSAENLLYISQAVSDENGNLNISYIPKEETEASEEFVANMIYDIKYSDVTIEDQNYTGEEITPTVTVKYNGNLLAEGTDYEISLVEKPIELGVYTVMISGMGNYYGDKAVSFRVVCKHEYVDGVCSVCGQEKPDNKGDINNDDVIDVSDMILLGRYLAGGWDDISINETNSDVNNDGNINIADLVMIGRYLAGGWDIELK